MADDRDGGYGRREGWRERESSIFSDDDRWDRGSGRWSSDHGRGRSGDDDRGFFERAGDEVRSWFGDEEAERRRERDVRRDEGRGGSGGRDWGSERGYERSGYQGGRGNMSGIQGGYGLSSQSGSDWEHGGRERAGWGSGWGGGGFGGSQDYDRGTGPHMTSGRSEQGRQGFGGSRSHWDDNYRRWRDQQIQQFDREFDDYCRERQQQFDQDFDSWRTSRLTEGGSSGTGATMQAGGGFTGTSGDSSRTQGTGSGTSRSMGSESAGTPTSGGGTGSAIGSSAGSTGAAAETGSTVGAGSSGRSGGRGGRSRT